MTKKQAFWDTVYDIWSVAWKIGLVIFAFWLLSNHLDAQEEKARVAEQKKMNDIIAQLDEHGYIEGSGDTGDCLYVKIRRSDIDNIEYFVNRIGDSLYNDLYFYAESHENVLSDEDLDLLYAVASNAEEMYITLWHISDRIPD